MCADRKEGRMLRGHVHIEGRSQLLYHEGNCALARGLSRCGLKQKARVTHVGHANDCWCRTVGQDLRQKIGRNRNSVSMKQVITKPRDKELIQSRLMLETEVSGIQQRQRSKN